MPCQSLSGRERGGSVRLFGAATSFLLRQERAPCRRFLDPGTERFFRLHPGLFEQRLFPGLGFFGLAVPGRSPPL